MGKTIFIIILLMVGIYHQGLAKKLKFAVNGGFNYSFAGCKKKTRRMAGDWTVTEYTEDGKSLLSRFGKDTITGTSCVPDVIIGTLDTTIVSFLWTFGKDGDFDYVRTWMRKSRDFFVSPDTPLCKYPIVTLTEGNEDAGRWEFFADKSRIELRYNRGYFGGIFPMASTVPEVWKQYYLILNAGVAIDIRNKQTITKRVVEDFFNTSYKASTSLANTIGVSLTAGIGVEHTLGKMGTIGIELSGFYGIFNNIIVDLVYTIESDSEPRYLLMRNTSLQMGLRYYPLWQKKKRKQKSQRPWQSPMPASYKK